MDISGIRKHSLLFNMSIPHHEKITMAELRLYTLVERDRRMYEGVDRKVYDTDSGWEAFDLTAAIRRWRKADYTTHRLEVHIESLGEDGEGYGEGNLDIDVNPEAKHVPLLIVFSDDQSNEKKEEKKELNEMIEHEQLLEFEMDMMNGLEDSPNEESLLQMRSNLIYDTTSRIRRNAKGNTCKKTPFFVEFNEIGWHSWIIAPTGYEAFKCSGVCNYPLIEHVTPTKHAIVQTLVHMKNPQKASRACCVPTKLDPISILYLDDAGVVTFKYKYEGMVVAECGCR
ncbi:Bone morphogenetic protein 10 [Acipenser ruthenus]|uniref:Bone morphogenetic protein 10 n=1 Tax=Acipenser ruthenus TaxID=7906 RepID=A0A444V2T6_ACIRT|nr:Bone morphogenetic protein 10 [Acipenser ruthenus]